MCEIVWVLERAYRYERALIAETNAMAGVGETATFDRKACELKGFVSVV